MVSTGRSTCRSSFIWRAGLHARLGFPRSAIFYSTPLSKLRGVALPSRGRKALLCVFIMYVCMCMYMYVRVYAYMQHDLYLCIYVDMFGCVHAYVRCIFEMYVSIALS